MSAVPMVLGLAWSRPQALWLLVMPLVLLVVALRRARPLTLDSGTVAIWRRVAGSAPDAAQRGSRPPWTTWCAALALGAGVLALAGPRGDLPRASRTWHVLVDRSPSMYLASEAADGGGTGPTRLERALEETRRLLAGRVGSDDEVVWSSWERGAWTHLEAVPPAWADAPSAPHGEPPFAERDRAGVVWVTDRAPDPVPSEAGLVAVGGAAVPGAVGARGSTRIDWDGQRLIEVADGLVPRPARWVGSTFELRPLAELFEIWAEERGLPYERVALETREPATLAVGQRVELPTREVLVGRDGWESAARVSAADAPALEDGIALEAWLAPRAGALAGRSLVAWRPGRIVLALAALGEPAGDPAAFAASWAELFDRASLAPEGVVALAERRAVPAAATREGLPAPPIVARGVARAGSEPTAILTVLAALCAAAAVGGVEMTRRRR